MMSSSLKLFGLLIIAKFEGAVFGRHPYAFRMMTVRYRRIVLFEGF